MRAASNYPFFLRLFITYESEISPDFSSRSTGSRSTAARLVLVEMAHAGTVGFRAGVVLALLTRPTQRRSWLRSAGKFRTGVTAWAWGRSGCHDVLRIHRPGIRSREIEALTLRKTGSMSVIDSMTMSAPTPE
jgi:hypothetical protein